MDYSSNLSFLRNNNSDHDGLHGYKNIAPYQNTDRRPSNPTMQSSYAAYSPGGESRGGTGGVMSNWAQHDANMNKHSQANPLPSFSHQHIPHRPTPSSTDSLYGTGYSAEHRDHQVFGQQMTSPSNAPQSTPNQTGRSTLWWGDLEPWMDEEYVKQVCKLMKWEPLGIKIPHPPPDPSSGQQPNNPGYCFLSFHTPAQAQAVLNQITGSSLPTIMPNSTKPFSMNWASSASAPSAPAAAPSTHSAPPAVPHSQGNDTSHASQFTKEYSIFVGDLAPETSNSDLVAVFRNPVLGLRNDREPKFIRPFASCKSAKIMLDPVTGVSRGYGFVRFTDEVDQQRTLIEMHGLYCLSRPMRISPATAKFKAPSPAADIPDNSSFGNGMSQAMTKSVSLPIAAVSPSHSLPSNGSIGGYIGASGSVSPFPTPNGHGSSSSLATAFASTEEMMNLPNSVLAQIAQQYAKGDSHPAKSPVPTVSITSQFAHEGGAPLSKPLEQGPRYMISEESWKHHAQARAILGNLMGPNGEQLTSTDPYNTTVFVGGLSPLISEDTLRTFFAPFGDIHYVKVPAGKHCGFVQFVRKADAERAIEKMQGFPVGGSRIRLSWGRSQYKAAQAAAQAAQTAALQGQHPPPTVPSKSSPETNPFVNITPEQAYHILQKIAASHGNNSAAMETATAQLESMTNHGTNPGLYADEDLRAAHLTSPNDIRPYEAYSPTAFSGGVIGPISPPMGTEPQPSQPQQTQKPQVSNVSLFSPFSPDIYKRDQPSQEFGGPWKLYSSRTTPEHVSPVESDTTKVGASNNSPRYGPFLNGSPPSSQRSRTPTRLEAPISRPMSEKSAHAVASEHDALHDLNGTLASLDLDRSWKSPE